MPTTGDRIRELRDRQGWTQERLAQEAHISKGFLSDVESNKRNVSSEYVLRIANALGASLDYLLRGEPGTRETEREPVSIPPELSAAAQELKLSYNETLTLLDANRSVVARRSNRSIKPLTKDEWKELHAAISRVYSGSATEE
jgi:transcriptional regulator with XRE-family HTH domain